jgi:arsenate reductase
MFKVMFLCTGNSCRSQMAEGWARSLGRGVIEAYSAGLFPVGVNPHATKAMAEVGIDITGQWSKAIDQVLLSRMDIVITLCDSAAELCPAVPGGMKRLHWPIDDPIRAQGTEEHIMKEFRRARDEIKAKVLGLVKQLHGI